MGVTDLEFGAGQVANEPISPDAGSDSGSLVLPERFGDEKERSKTQVRSSWSRLMCHVRIIEGLLLLLLLPVSWLALQPRSTSAQASVEPPKLFFFTHHKTGTILAQGIAQAMANRISPERRISEFTRDSTACIAEQVGIMETLDVATLDKIKRVCNDNFLAVHLVRDPVGTVLSGYSYHSHSDDVIPHLENAPTPEVYGQMTLRDGLVTEAVAELKSTLPDMLETLEISKNDHRILTIRFEDFSKDFDGATRRIFTHFLGPNQDRLVSELIKVAAVNDVSRWSQEKKVASDHVAMSDAKKSAASAMESLFAEREPSVTKVYDLREPMGYEQV